MGRSRDVNPRPAREFPKLVLGWTALEVCLVLGCRTAAPRADFIVSDSVIPRTYVLHHVTFEPCRAILDALGLQDIEYTPDANCLSLKGTPDQLRRADTVLDMIDVPEDYCCENLGPASRARTLPSNPQIAAALGRIDIGTFEQPPVGAAGARAIVDLQGGAVIAILPARRLAALRQLLSNPSGLVHGPKTRPDRTEPNQVTAKSIDNRPTTGNSGTTEEAGLNSVVLATMGEERRPGRGNVSSEETRENGRQPPAQVGDGFSGERDLSGKQLPKTTKIVFARTPQGEKERATAVTERAVPENGEDVLALTLPETMTVTNLLDLAGKYLGLNYLYEPGDIADQPLSLKLHGNLQGEMKVRHLYTLVETVLNSRGLAMIRRGQNLVAVVPMEKALQSQPQLVGPAHPAVPIGDTLVIRAFQIQHADVASVKTLLESMKLCLAATPLEESHLLLVTCPADRLSRIEQLVELIDRPGADRECRLRGLYYTAATPLVAKVRAAMQRVQTVDTAPTPAMPRRTPPPEMPMSAPSESNTKAGVYLDADERTNRILMIGSADELQQIEELIDVLDVAGEDPRWPRVYRVRHLKAQQALEKLRELEVLEVAPSIPVVPDLPERSADTITPAAEPLVAVLEATNELLIRATPDQYERICEFLACIDVPPDDGRTIVAYELRQIDAEVARKILTDLDLITVESVAPSAGPTGDLSQPGIPRRNLSPVTPIAGRSVGAAAVVVSKSNNALLVTATAEQHARLVRIIRYIDAQAPEDEEMYQMYPLESSSPAHLAGLLERLLTETTKGKDGQIERIAKTKERIAIVPDPNTFSLVVYASHRNQRRIEELIRKLDKRRPQVLIDVTLVEITRADTFDYDLSVVARAHGAVTENVVVNPIQTVSNARRLEAGFNVLDAEGHPTGRFQAFYSDEHIQALLTAMQRKNYGRVLAKPRVLVDDGHKGQIVTMDTTTYVKESIQIPQTGTPITTREFVPIEASIKLDITPHISEGNLLRLDVFMSRDDFGPRPLAGAPPDKATSEVTTTVFVPDDNTVILGGLVKLNQSKGGSKVPILGDVPLLGILFRSANNSNIEKKLYVFLKANIVRPYDAAGLTDLQRISEENQAAFEESEAQFQKFQTIPGIPPKPMPPVNVLPDYK